MYTTIEQSKKLIELGLDPNTADLSYNNSCMKGLGYCGHFSITITPYKEAVKQLKENIEYFSKGGYNGVIAWEVYPSWSVSALLEIMPSEIYPENGEWKDIPYWGYTPVLRKYHETYDGEDFGDSYFMQYQSANEGDNRILKEFDGGEQIDVCYDMMVWLLENNFIEK